MRWDKESLEYSIRHLFYELNWFKKNKNYKILTYDPASTVKKSVYNFNNSPPIT